tara:strand:- start:39488 stop:39772 length:285 start_codon:yes stop_codon:yes gene_type:complete
MKRHSALVSGILILFFVGNALAQSGYLKIGDIKGESTERAHKDWIVIESFSQGLEQQQLAMTGSTRRRTSVVFEDLVITKKTGQSNTKINGNLC